MSGLTTCCCLSRCCCRSRGCWRCCCAQNFAESFWLRLLAVAHAHRNWASASALSAQLLPSLPTPAPATPLLRLPSRIKVKRQREIKLISVFLIWMWKALARPVAVQLLSSWVHQRSSSIRSSIAPPARVSVSRLWSPIEQPLKTKKNDIQCVLITKNWNTERISNKIQDNLWTKVIIRLPKPR